MSDAPKARRTRLKSERVQGQDRASGSPGSATEPLREAEYRFATASAALQFAAVAAMGCFFFGLAPRLHCADGRVRIWFPREVRSPALQLARQDGTAAFLQALKALAEEMRRGAGGATSRPLR
jgi:hypothetical protein